MPEAVIVSTARTPIGRAFKGSLAEMRADELAAVAIQAALAQVPSLDPTDIEDLILGCGLPGGESGFNMARIVSVLMDMDHLPGTTVNRYCSSSLQSTRMALHAIKAGEGDVFISAGVEAVSRSTKGHSDNLPDTENPIFAEAAKRTADRVATGGAWSDPRDAGDLPDVYISMGLTAENVAELHGVSRADQDAFAVRSQNLTNQAQAEGFWDRDLLPVQLPNGQVADRDDSPRAGVTMESVGALSPAFRPDGTVTAGNACPLNDGAAALVIMSDTKARELGLTPLARIVSTAVSGLAPEIMGLGPVEASRRALARAGLGVDDIDLFEINEAFAAQVIASGRELGLDFDRLNVHGGAIAVGHPFGMTGARIASTLVNGLQVKDKQFGLETMCVGGGQGMAMVIERLS
ncbi:acetyl-CoA C-acetyltransferase [Nocardioides limicola]|uniref:acetyl-CoA C-acetyltransferase n=1 Tax=Nocardioides limicola TaxID=2803368 RepID=UPI00193C0CDD|nr:acetyl-CoA C-acetyltransferase [Nocardioides sp. DJM-14]